MRGAMVWLSAAAAAVLVSFSGCGGDDGLNSPTAKKLTSVSTLYLDYAVGKAGAGPPNDAALKKHIKGLYASVLAHHGIDPNNLDDLFKSERDGQPFVVLYGTSVTSVSANSKQVIAHEATGKNGKRLVATAGMKVLSVTDAELEKLKSGETNSTDEKK